MTRLIYCYECATAANRFKLNRFKLNPDDVRMGWQNRRQWGRAHCPEGHNITIRSIVIGAPEEEMQNTPGSAGFPRSRRLVETLPSLRCDLCGNDVPDSAPILAVTEWLGEEPAVWEPEYMEVVTEEEWHRIAARIGLVRKRLDECEGKTETTRPWN